MKVIFQFGETDNKQQTNKYITGSDKCYRKNTEQHKGKENDNKEWGLIREEL